MKLAGNILIILVIAVSVQSESINQHYNDYIQSKENGNSNSYDDNCIKENLKLNKYGEKSLTLFEFNFLFDYLRFYCSEQSAIEYEANSYKFLISHFGIASSKYAIPCMKKKVLDLEPTTKYVKIIDGNKPDCIYDTFSEGLPFGLRFIYEQNAKDTLEFAKTCSQVSLDEYTKIILKSVLYNLVGFSDDEKASEELKLMKEYKEFKKIGHDCIIKKFESE